MSRHRRSTGIHTPHATGAAAWPWRRIRDLAFVAALLALLWQPGAVAELRVQVDRSEIQPDEPFTLLVEYDGAATPDFSVLGRDFNVLGTQQASRIQITNGEVTRSRTWQLRLLPKRAGVLSIPALRLGAEQSRPIRITVAHGTSAASDGTHDAVRFESRVAPDKRYVQAQVTYVRRLLYTGEAQVYGDLPGLPDIPGAIVQPLAAPEPDSTVIGGVPYNVLEQRFAIFPQRSGEFVIPSVSVDASVGAPGGLRHRALVESAPVRVQVLPVPAAYPAGAAWLPAQSVTIDEDLRTPTRLEVGQPIVRTLRIRSEGLSVSTLPDTPWRATGRYRLYSEPPVIQESTDGMFITGTRLQRHTFVPTQPGTLTLPGQDLTWWDVNAGVVRHATLPPRSFTITGTAMPMPPTELAGAQRRDDPDDDGPWQALLRTVSDWQGAPWVLAALALGAAFALLPWTFRNGSAWLRMQHARRQARHDAPEARAARQAAVLAACCEHADPVQARRAFTEWLALQAQAPRWADDAPVRSLREAANARADHWDGAAFWRWFSSQAPNAAGRASSAAGGRTDAAPPGRGADPAALPPLYPVS